MTNSNYFHDLLLVIEDDPIQSETILSVLRQAFPCYEVVLAETESDFRAYVASLAHSHRIVAVVSDVMMPWCHPSDKSPTPPREVLMGTYRQAGTRCFDWFRKRLQKTPWVYFTVLDESTIDFERHSDKQTRYVQKSGSISSLIEAVRGLIENK